MAKWAPLMSGRVSAGSQYFRRAIGEVAEGPPSSRRRPKIVKRYSKRELASFLRESNAIEDEYSVAAYKTAKDAWLYAESELLDGHKEIDISIIAQVHKILMADLNHRIAGHLRTVGVRVGIRICPSPDRVRRMLIQWVKQYNGYTTGTYETVKSPENVAKAIHVEFEKIHPFEDGNGRVGRILYNVHRLQLGLSIEVIKADERQEYYKWFGEA